MKVFRLYALGFVVIASLFVLFVPQVEAFPNPEHLRPSEREPFVSTMRKIASDFEKLTPILASSDTFSSPAREEEIRSIIGRLRDNFLLILPGTGAVDPAYDISLYSIRDILSDAQLRFDAGKKDYARWRLRSLATNCVSCHARFSFGAEYRDGVHEDHVRGLSDFERGEYFLATRQFSEAGDAYLRAAKDSSQSAYERMEALRKVLLSQVRLENNPRESLSLFSRLRGELKLPAAQTQEVDQWIASFRRWLGERPQVASEFRRAENLIQQYTHVASEGVGQVELLRASAILHRLLSSPEQVLPQDFSRARALALLGEAYMHMPLLFSPELPEFYFEQCIQEYPGTRSAQDCYRSYHELTVRNYTGSAGLDLPAEVRSRLRALHSRAFGAQE